MTIDIDVKIRNLELIIRQRRDSRRELLSYIRDNINRNIKMPIEMTHVRDKVNMGKEEDYTDIEILEIAKFLRGC